jgi:3-phenylpropionate/trans-cinnamate dioxygenase ferredoxin reductase subunit
VPENRDRIVVVGAGHAAGQLVASLRGEGFAGDITLIGEEPVHPYQRPPLSKQYLAGELSGDRLLFRPADFYRKNAVQIRLGCRAIGIDRDARTVTLEGGERIGYSGLALATGARVRPLPVEGHDLAGVFYLRTIDDVNRIRARLETARAVVIIGGGFIGLEVAAVMAKLGKRVTVLEMQDRLMPRVVSPTVSEFYREAHARHGVRVVTGAQVSALAGTNGEVRAVACAGGEECAADLVVIGIGVIPNTVLAQSAGLACDNGIVVDEFASTSDPRVVAAGDCTNHPSAWAGRRLRLESVQNALDQSKIAAATLCDKRRPYREVPWFWSDQYDLKLQMVGLSQGFDREIVRGAIGEGRFSVFYFRGERLLAVDSISRPADHMVSRRLLGAGVAVTPEQAGDPDFELKSLL